MIADKLEAPHSREIFKRGGFNLNIHYIFYQTRIAKNAYRSKPINTIPVFM